MTAAGYGFRHDQDLHPVQLGYVPPAKKSQKALYLRKLNKDLHGSSKGQVAASLAHQSQMSANSVSHYFN